MGSAEQSSVNLCAHRSDFHYWLSFMSGIISVKKNVDLNAHANRITEFPFWLIFSNFCGKILFSKAVFLG